MDVTIDCVDILLFTQVRRPDHVGATVRKSFPPPPTHSLDGSVNYCFGRRQSVAICLTGAIIHGRLDSCVYILGL